MTIRALLLCLAYLSASPGTVVLGTLQGANFNSTLNQAIPISAASYRVTRIVVSNCSASLTLAVGGVCTATLKRGTAVVANTQIYSALTDQTLNLNLTLTGPGGGTLSAATLYLSLTVPQGLAATCDVAVIGAALS